MTLTFIYIIVMLLIARLILTFNDNSLRLKQLIIIVVFQLASLILLSGVWTLISLGFLIVVFSVLFFLWEQKASLYLSEIRFLSFIVQTMMYSIFCAPVIGLSFNQGALDLLSGLPHYSLLFSFINKIDWMNSGMIMLGALLVLNESNLVIRSLFHLFRIFPGTTTEDIVPKIDKREYNAGRIIGILERIIIYFAVLYDQYTVIGFLMAAKGFTRFREMDDRNFAEYILIGTLLSTLAGIFAGVLVKSLL